MSIEAISATSTATTTTSTTQTLDSDDFLTLLTTQLQYQDPTDPLDSDDMSAQLTQYSQLEQMVTMNTNLESMMDKLDSMVAMGSFDYLGKTIEAVDSSIVKSGDTITSTSFNLESDAETVLINVYDSSGNIVSTEYMFDVAEGDHTYQWDGTDQDGNTLDDGDYSFFVIASDENDATVESSTSVTGTVSGIAQTDEGVLLTLDDGRVVNLTSVTSVS